jgi:LmbE family N-acetylglucosaminyl deacetylase
MSDQFNSRSILAVGAHPDDIEIGCGGSLIKYAQNGFDVFLLVLTMGAVGGDPEVRKREQEEAALFMGAKQVFWGNFQDTDMPRVNRVISVIEDVIDKVNPDSVLFNYYDDTHQDHRITAEACMSATRYIKEVLYYEVPTSRNFEPRVFIDIKDVIDRKLELLKLHSSQVDRTRVKDLTIVESATACAIFRGYQGRVKYAEGFNALRILI